MTFLLDHDVPEDLSYLLEQLGHDVTLLPAQENRRGCKLTAHNHSRSQTGRRLHPRHLAEGLYARRRCFVSWSAPGRPD